MCSFPIACILEEATTGAPVLCYEDAVESASVGPTAASGRLLLFNSAPTEGSMFVSRDCSCRLPVNSLPRIAVDHGPHNDKHRSRPMRSVDHNEPLDLHERMTG